jgi:cytochrome c556
MSGRNRLILLGAVVAVMLVGVIFLQASNGSELPEIVTQRQEAMKGLGGNMKAIGESLESGSPDAALIAEKANAIGDTASLIPTLFPEGTSLEDIEGRVGAKPEIWQDWAGFEAAATTLGSAADALIAATETGDAAAMQAAFDALGKDGCGGCHTKFRQKLE